LISHQWGQDSVDYETFLRIAAPRELAADASTIDGGAEFHWLWRSSLNDYAECNRIWHTWLNRTVLWWNRKLLRYKSVWVNSFRIYDQLERLEPDKFAPEEPDAMQQLQQRFRQAPGDDKKKVLDEYTGVFEFPQLKVRHEFLQLKNILIKELEQASGARLEDREASEND